MGINVQEMLEKIVEKLETQANEAIVSRHVIYCSGKSEGYDNSAEIVKQIAAEYGFSLADVKRLKVGNKVRIITNDDDDVDTPRFYAGTLGVIVADKSDDPTYCNPYQVEANGKKFWYKGNALKVISDK